MFFHLNFISRQWRTGGRSVAGEEQLVCLCGLFVDTLHCAIHSRQKQTKQCAIHFSRPLLVYGMVWDATSRQQVASNTSVSQFPFPIVLSSRFTSSPTHLRPHLHAIPLSPSVSLPLSPPPLATHYNQAFLLLVSYTPYHTHGLVHIIHALLSFSTFSTHFSPLRRLNSLFNRLQ